MAKKKYQRDVHHRRPFCESHDDSPENRSLVRVSHHRAYHHLFGTNTGTMTPEQIANYLNSVWIDPNKLMIVVPRKVLVVMPELPFPKD